MNWSIENKMIQVKDRFCEIHFFPIDGSTKVPPRALVMEYIRAPTNANPMPLMFAFENLSPPNICRPAMMINNRLRASHVP
mmetsp:Transcript_16469/g.24911  ORF Transcript_16469/g.24911 Transcript_16469/m.24911 type:complete len:81 (+) Transcript_16469:1384-1626(+)